MSISVTHSGVVVALDPAERPRGDLCPEEIRDLVTGALALGSPDHVRLGELFSLRWHSPSAGAGPLMRSHAAAILAVLRALHPMDTMADYALLAVCEDDVDQRYLRVQL